MKKLILIVLFLGLAASVLAQEEPKGFSVIYNQPYDAVWMATIKAIDEEGLVLTGADTESGLITTDYAKLPGSRDIPKRINRVAQFKKRHMPFVDARYSLAVAVSLVSNTQTKVIINAIVEGDNQENWIAFESNGTIEQVIFDLIDNQLLGRK